jgi:hypothetical protein
MTDSHTTERLKRLEEQYAYRINLLLEEDREDLAAQLSDVYLEHAKRVLLTADAAS